MPRYGLATIIGPHPVGYEFKSSDLPLHITHVDSFEIELTANALATKLQQALTHQPAFKVQALADELYGPEKDILVTTLDVTPAFSKLHSTIMALLAEESAILKNPQFHNDGFQPHISVYGERRVTIGNFIEIADISIAAKVSDAEDANRRVLANISLD